AAMERAIRDTFEKLGQTHLELGSLSIRNDHNRFVPVSRLNQLRRDLAAALEQTLHQHQNEQLRRLQNELTPRAQNRRLPSHSFRWSIKVDRIGFLDALEDVDLAGVEEIVVDIARDHPALLVEKLQEWDMQVGRER